MLEHLKQFLKPPGIGMFSPSLGTNPWAKNLHLRLYGTYNPVKVQKAWEKSLLDIEKKEVILIGIPSDIGSGARRGAAFGPIGVREAYYKNYSQNIFLDLGDILTIPHLLHDELLNNKQISIIRENIYKDTSNNFPISPLSITAYVVKYIKDHFPNKTIISIGGDHSITAGCLEGLLESSKTRVSIIHIDAHNDLARNRFGITPTYASWVQHIKQKFDLSLIIQLGLDKEQTILCDENIFQYNSYDFQLNTLNDIVDEIFNLLLKNEIEDVYLTLDMDVINKVFAPSVAIPNENGLSSDKVYELLKKIKFYLKYHNIHFMGGDIVEVAPILSSEDSWHQEVTCVTSAKYLDVLFSS